MIYKFIDDQGTFTVKNPQRFSGLYFPLTDKSGRLLSSISPNLAGDIKKDNSSFLMPPAGIQDITHNPLCRRDFFLSLSGKNKTRVLRCSQSWDDTLEAGFLYHKLIKKDPCFRVEIVNFIPHDLAAEVMWVKVKNVSSFPRTFVPTSFMPLYGRGEATLHDHRHVSSLLNRVKLSSYGIDLKPTMIFDEQGHRINRRTYFVRGYQDAGLSFEGQFPTLESFCGRGGSLQRPSAVYGSEKPFTRFRPEFDGKEVCAAFRFRKKTLQKGEETNYVLIAGISDDRKSPDYYFKKLDSTRKVNAALEATVAYWQNHLSLLRFKFNDRCYDNWLRWVQFQPTLRKLFGCSFLPHFDYGKGGRGFRDLWQDILSLLLRDEPDIKDLIINNFRSLRIDGSNATIITAGNEFLADRNRITRVWTDHGIWPLLTTALYLERSADLGILDKKIPYFKDCQLKRAREFDMTDVTPDRCLRTTENKVYRGTLLEHLLIENVVQFYNVGGHNILKLENGDWNDGLDMAFGKGESVPFYCMYAANLLTLASLLEKLKEKRVRVKLLKEAALLFDTLSTPISYSSVKKKQLLLDQYLEKTKHRVSGKTVSLDTGLLIKDLAKKARWILDHVRRREWLPQGFFNGYYDNNGEAVEGGSGKKTRLLLQSQVFAIMSGAASEEQTGRIWRSILTHLKDASLKGFRLNTDFRALLPELGRAFAFSYGDKENGAFFNHMSVMLGYALFKRNFPGQGHQVFSSLYTMASSLKAGIYPMLPEYFNGQGRGLYSYLTGSASWYIYTLYEQVLGISCKSGSLTLSPRLTGHHFFSGPVTVSFSLGGKKLTVQYRSTAATKKYIPGKALLNGIPLAIEQGKVKLGRKELKSLPDKKENLITVDLC